MASKFAQRFAAKSVPALFDRFGDSIIYTAGSASGVSVSAIVDTSEYDLAFKTDGAGELHEIRVKLRASDAPSLAISDMIEWNSRNYIVRAVTPNSGVGIVQCRAVEYSPRVKGRSEPFLKRG